MNDLLTNNKNQNNPAFIKALTYWAAFACLSGQSLSSVVALWCEQLLLQRFSIMSLLGMILVAV